MQHYDPYSQYNAFNSAYGQATNPDLTLQALPLTTQNINAIFNQKGDDLFPKFDVFNADGTPNANFGNQIREKMAFTQAYQSRKDAILKPVADLIIATGKNQGKGMDGTGNFTGFQSRQGYAYLYDDGRTKVASLIPNHDIDVSQGIATTAQTTSLGPTPEEQDKQIIVTLQMMTEMPAVDTLEKAKMVEQGLPQLGLMFNPTNPDTQAMFNSSNPAVQQALFQFRRAFTKSIVQAESLLGYKLTVPVMELIDLGLYGELKEALGVKPPVKAVRVVASTPPPPSKPQPVKAKVISSKHSPDYQELALYTAAGAMGGKVFFDKPILGAVVGAVAPFLLANLKK